MKLNNENAGKILAMYQKRVAYIIKPLSEKDRRDIEMELDSHIYESMARYPKQDEVSTLLYALEKLGEPEQFLPAVVAERKLAQAGKSFNPAHIASALALNIGRGFIKTVLFIISSLLYLFSAALIILSVLKLFSPRHTGVFIDESSHISIAWLQTVRPGTRELLGLWFTPAAIITAALIYVINTILLKYIPRKRKTTK